MTSTIAASIIQDLQYGGARTTLCLLPFHVRYDIWLQYRHRAFSLPDTLLSCIDDAGDLRSFEESTHPY